jgi:hypothetical protein
MNSPDRQPNSLDDDALQELLAAALRQADPVPGHVVDAARGAFTWRTIDQELADLVFDSDAELTGVRDHGATRQLTFQTSGLEIEVMVTDPARRRIVGQLVPAQETAVQLESPETRVEQRSDRFGRFTFEGVPSGPVRLGIVTAGGSVVNTDWVMLWRRLPPSWA